MFHYQLPKGTQVVPSLLLVHAHKISDLQFSLVILTTMSASALLFSNYYLHYLFIYSFDFLWTVQLHYTAKTVEYAKFASTEG